MRQKSPSKPSIESFSISFFQRFPEWLRAGILLLLLLVAGWLTVTKKFLVHQGIVPMETPSANPSVVKQSMKIGSADLLVEVRRTAEEQGLGLSWRTSMGQDEGMVFVYAAPQKVMYWMRGMQFPLDFLWVRQGKVVELTSRVPFPTKDDPVPRTLVPTEVVDMVIEVNAGWIEAHGIKTGDEVSISY